MSAWISSEIAITAAMAVLAAWAAMVWLAPRIGPASSARIDAKRAVFLLDGDVVTDLTDEAEALLPDTDGTPRWQDLHAALCGAFPDLPEACDGIGTPLELTAAEGSARLRCETIDGIMRVELEMGDTPFLTRLSPAERNSVAVAQAPYPVWCIDTASGGVLWANAAHEDLARRVDRDQTANEGEATPLFRLDPASRPGRRRTRTALAVPTGDRKLWFDITQVPAGRQTLCYAIDVNAVVEAEIAQRNFVQTLAKTFAQLSIGLAIFDRNRRLALFNPALVDLTALPVEFLSGRPDLPTFFDHLREQRMMPEPKDYRSWRQSVTDLAEAAADGSYQETWTLPSGSVYSVSGRPHPDGAVAFLFEDITAEVTLTRRFRADLEQSQAVLDALDPAIAVFQQTGALIQSNAAFHQLWDVDPGRSFADVTLVDLMRVWHERCRPSPAWGDLRDFVATRDGRAGWTAEVALRQGGMLACSAHPLPGGATLVAFSAIDNVLRDAQQPGALAMRSEPVKRARLAGG